MEYGLHPKQDLVGVKINEDSATTSSGIILTESRFSTGEVLGKSEKVTSLNVGDTVLFDRTSVIRVDYNGNTFTLVRESEILGTLVRI